MLENDYILFFSIIFLTVVLSIIFIVLLVSIIRHILKSPFEYPYFNYSFDVTSKRNVKVEDCIDKFLMSQANWNMLQQHQLKILRWKLDSERFLESCALKKYRTRQYREALDDKNAFCFTLIRKQTRYRQYNYAKKSYKVNSIDSKWSADWDWISFRYKRLKSIGFEATLSDYNCKSQRKMMTPLLRKQIMERDNYTCRICGKFMPDEVGLHIDHIIPIAKGGKSVYSNLQVLCSKCNGKKGAK